MVAARVVRTAISVNARGNECPKPRFDLAFRRGRFVDPQHRLLRQLGGQFLVSWPESRRRLTLQLDHPPRRARLIHNLLAEQDDAAPALLETATQQRHERNQPRTCLTVRNAKGVSGRPNDTSEGRFKRYQLKTKGLLLSRGAFSSQETRLRGCNGLSTGHGQDVVDQAVTREWNVRA